MVDVLRQARNTGEFPATTTPPSDAPAVVADYQSLMRLRELRGSSAYPASQEYIRFRVEVARRINERDTANVDDEAAEKKEARRRVDSFLRSVEQEERVLDGFGAHYRSASGRVADPTAVGERLYSIAEHTIEQTMADAMGPLRMNIGMLKEQTVMLGRQIDMHHRAVDQQNAVNAALVALVEQQSRANSALMSMIVPQQASHAPPSSHLNLVTNQLATVNDQLAVANDLVRSLSGIISNLAPGSGNPPRGVSPDDQQRQQMILHTQQQMFADIQQQSQHLHNMAADVRAGRATVRPPTSPSSPQPLSAMRERTRGGVRRIMDRVFH